MTAPTSATLTRVATAAALASTALGTLRATVRAAAMRHLDNARASVLAALRAVGLDAEGGQ